MGSTDNQGDEKPPIIFTEDTNESIGAATGKQLRVDVDTNTDAINIINARSEAGLRNRALTFSMVTCTWYMPLQIWCSYIGKPLTVPEIVNQVLWAIIVGPWLGFGMGKIVMMLVEKFGNKK